MTARRARVSVLLVLLGLIGSLFVTPASAQAAARTLAVSPATGLEDQVVRVSWTGFHPTVNGAFTVTLYQCKGAQPHSLSGCYKDFRPPVTEFGTATDQATTGTDGSGSTDFEVRPGPNLPQLGCSSTSPCSIVAYENDGSDLPASGLPVTAASARLEFAPSPSDCPKVTTPDVTTEGEGSTASALYAWSSRVCTGTAPLSLDYTESNSPFARGDFLKGLVDVGLTTTAPTAAEIAAGTKRAFTLAPVDLTGVVVAFNVSDKVTHERITDMNLTPRLVAIMIAGGQFGGPGQSLFSDAQFVALNPGHHWPDRAEPPLLRSERNADAYVLTGWLNADSSARAFLDGKDGTAEVDPYWKNVSYPTDVFEARDPSTLGSYNPRSGTLVNARRLFNFQAPGDAAVSPANDGVLGVMDVVTARKFGFPTAKLRPANNSTNGFVAADSSGLLAGYHAMKTTADKLTKVANPAASGGYPLVKIDYALVPTSGTSKPKAQHIAQFLSYAAGGGQAAGVLSPGYVALPPELRAQAVAAQHAVIAGQPTHPPTTNPPPSTNPPSTPGSGSPGMTGGTLGGGVPAGGSNGLFTDSGGTSLGSSGFGSASDGSALGGSGAGNGSLGDTSPGTGSGTTSASGSSSAGTTPGSLAGGNADAATGATRIRQIGRFGGADAQEVLPALLGSGVAALTVGPGLSLWMRRKSKQRSKLHVEGVAQ